MKKTFFYREKYNITGHWEHTKHCHELVFEYEVGDGAADNRCGLPPADRTPAEQAGCIRDRRLCRAKAVG